MGRQDAESETLIPITGGVFDVAHALRADGFDASEDGTGRGTPLCVVAGTLGANHGNIKAEHAWTNQLVCFDTTQITSPENGSQGSSRRCHTLSSHQHPPALVDYMRVRRLTPLECERLQGLPDNYTLIQYRNGMAKDGPRYRAIGNSMAVNVMSWIGQRIQQVEKISPAFAAG